MAYLWTTLKVRNLETSLYFYRNILGLSLERRFTPAPGMSIAFLSSGETKIELIETLSASEPSYGKEISLGFSVSSLKEISELLEKENIPILDGPFSPNPAIQFLYIEDPDGLKIQLVEELLHA